MILAILILAQVAANQSNEWITPVSGAAVVGLLTALTKWLMNTITQELKALTLTINEHTRSLERALDHNTRATLLMGIATEQSNRDLQAKLQACYEELERKSQRKDQG